MLPYIEINVRPSIFLYLETDYYIERYKRLIFLAVLYIDDFGSNSLKMYKLVYP